MGKTEKDVQLPPRAEQAKAREAEVYYPPLAGEVRYLLEYLQALDYVEPGMAGPVRLSYREIEAWTQLSGVSLRPWEVTTLRAMSAEFAREIRAAEDPKHPAPWAPEPEQLDRKAVARRIKDALRG